ncbi:LacI family DNA-binding transcriptional regulator [Vibrio sp. JPW-9-11-11]|uniref:substrate-binding domain-containing protein n=1 Tax=Vibrio sp. JPW-9-11-11 TaxID=1416532 RepID=UPI0015945C03|nr:LacI family DNA-binding transcriptional regulator [Vibrio sp. JPW-9-11-11]NVD06484.1 LacI family DNA-binding transcriptional regulator [Vibrio sp. JPW-9-11-11]
MTGKKLRLADIAQLAGVSKSTVSFVLNGHAQKHRINEQTVKKVQAIAQANNYSPSIYARALKSKQTYTVGLVIPDLTNMGFATIAKHLECHCRQAGYQLLIACSDDNPQMEQQVIEGLIDRQVDLLFVASAACDGHYLQQVAKQTPVILFDRVIEGAALTSVKTDAARATQQVVERLVKGLDECAYLGGQLELSPSKERLAGYQAALNTVGIGVQPQLVLSKDYQPLSGYQMMSAVIDELGRPPKALFTASYSLLEGVLRYLTEHNLLDSPIRLATFDNYDILDCLPIKVDSIEQDCALIAQTLFETATQRLANPDLSISSHVLEAKIHLRRPQV